MKKTLLLTTLLLLLIGVTLPAYAVTLTIGDIAFKFDDFTYFDLPDANGDGFSDLPGVNGDLNTVPATGPGSGRSWGIANITSIHTIVAGDLEEATLLSTVPIWTPSVGDYLQVRFGGIILDQTHATYPIAAGTTTYDLYFDNDIAPYVSPTSGGAYMEIYHNTADGVTADYLAGPGTGVYNSFGTTVDDGNLWLEIALTAGALNAYDPSAEGPLNTINSADWDVEKTTISSLTTAAATIYGDIIGGSALTQYTFADGVFPLDLAAYPVRSDVKFQSNLTAIYDQANNVWQDPQGWTNSSQDPVTMRVAPIPEPATIFLFGFGLMGLASLARRKK